MVSMTFRRHVLVFFQALSCLHSGLAPIAI